MCKFPIPFIYFSFISSLLLIISVWASTLSVSLYLQCPIMCKFFCYHYIFNISFTSYHYIFRMSLCASSLSIYISLFLQCPIMCKFLSFYVSLYIQCPILGKYPIVLRIIRSAVSHYEQFYFCVSIQCPIMCKFSIFLHSIISLVSHSGQVPYSFTFHYFFSVPLCASTLSFYVSLYLQCPVMCKFIIFSSLCLIIFMCNFPIYLHFIIFSVPLCASSLSFYVSLYIQCPIMCKYPIILCFIISSVSHYVQVPYLIIFLMVFTSKYPISLYLSHVPLCASSLSIYIHQIFSVPLCACSLSFYLSLYLQFPIMCKFPNFLCFVISSVSHSGQVPYSFTFHYIFSVPLCASSPYFYISFYIQCPILCKFPNFLCFVISSVSHSGQVPNNFVLHYIFSVPLCASSLSFYLSLFPLCTIMCKFSFFLPFIICSVSHYVQVLHLFTSHYIFSVPLWASSLSIYISLYLQCPILGKYPIILCFIIYLVSHYVQVPYLFIYIPLDLQCPILGKFPIYLHFIISLVPIWGKFPIYLHHFFSVPFGQVLYLFTFHYIFSVPFGQVPYLFTFHQIFSVPLCASSPSFYIPLYLQCPIMCKYPIVLHFIISSVSHYVQVPYLFTFHYIFSFPLCASSLLLIHFILLVSHSGKVPYSSTFISSVSHLCASSHYIFCPISLYLSVSHFGQVPYLFTFHYIFSVPFGASSLSIYIPLDLQCPIMCMFPIFLPFIISLVSHHVQVP